MLRSLRVALLLAASAQDHGAGMVQLRGGRIARWRESRTESSLPFEELSAGVHGARRPRDFHL